MSIPATGSVSTPRTWWSPVLSFFVAGTTYSQRLGDLAGPSIPDQDSLTFSLIAANSTMVENVTVPYIASFTGVTFDDQKSQ